MSKPIRTTLAFGLISSLIILPVAWYEQIGWTWPSIFYLCLWANVTLYGMILSRWSRVSFFKILFPLLLLLGAAAWPTSNRAFFLIALGVFSWVRSGVCFTATPLRALMAELAIGLGATCMIGLLWPQSALAWALGIWFFYLVQSLYFFIVPMPNDSSERTTIRDPFEQARMELERILENF